MYDGEGVATYLCAYVCMFRGASVCVGVLLGESTYMWRVNVTSDSCSSGILLMSAETSLPEGRGAEQSSQGGCPLLLPRGSLGSAFPQEGLLL